MTFLLLVTYCKVGRGQLIGMIRVRIVMIMMMIGLSSCPVNTRSIYFTGNQTTRNFLSLFFVFIAVKVAGASLIVAVRIPGP